METLTRRGVAFDGVLVPGRLRRCYAIRDARGAITELLESGPALDADAVDRLERAFLAACATSAVVVMSGSLPAGCPADTYARLSARLAVPAPLSLVDASGDALREALAARPTVVKPNRDEAAELTGRPIRTPADALQAAAEIARHGAQIVVISLGEEGAAVIWDGRPVRVHAPRVAVVSAVGSGDCFVAGLAAGLARGLEAEPTLRLAAACGAANALSEEPGRFDRDVVARSSPRWASSGCDIRLAPKCLPTDRQAAVARAARAGNSKASESLLQFANSDIA